MDPPGSSRNRLVGILHAAYASGLLSDDTFVRRLDQVFRSRLIDPRRLVGDLNLRSRRRGVRTRLASAASWARSRGSRSSAPAPVLLALDWGSERQELLMGRDHRCDVVLSDPSVSRLHARLVPRDGGWVLEDLASTNGTVVNGVEVRRCQLRPGDRLLVGRSLLEID